MASFWRHLGAIWRKKCPRCLEGPLYKHGMTMHERCPVCDMQIEREQGYFLGAMYISYALASLFLGVLTYLVYLVVPEWGLGTALLIAAALFVPFVPAVTRYARILWIHWDRWAWP